MSAERYIDTQQKKKKSRAKGSFAIILVLLIIVAIAVGYLHVREHGVASLRDLTFCGGEISSSDTVSGGDAASGTDIVQPERSVSPTDASDSDVSASDASADEPGFFGKVGAWFASAGKWISNAWDGVVGWFDRVFSGCAVADREVSDDVSATDSESIDRTLEEMQYWDIPGDDAQYNAMMQEKAEEAIDFLTELTALEGELGKYASADAVRRDTRFVELERRIENWCGAALAYPQETLFSAQAQDTWQYAHALAQATLRYLNAYPEIVTGNYKASEGDPTAEQLLNDVTEATVNLYGSVYGAPQTAAPSGSDA